MASNKEVILILALDGVLAVLNSLKILKEGDFIKFKILIAVVLIVYAAFKGQLFKGEIAS